VGDVAEAEAPRGQILGRVAELADAGRDELHRPAAALGAPEHDHGGRAVDDARHLLEAGEGGAQLLLRLAADRDVATHPEEGAALVAVGVGGAGGGVPDPASVAVTRAILDALAVAAGGERAGEKRVPKPHVVGMNEIPERRADDLVHRMPELRRPGLRHELHVSFRGERVEDLARGLDVGAPARLGAPQLVLGEAPRGDILEHREVVRDATAARRTHHDHREDAPDEPAVGVDVALLQDEGVALAGVNLVIELVLALPVVGVGDALDVADVGGLLGGEADELAEAPVDVIDAGLAVFVDLAPAQPDRGMVEEQLQLARLLGELPLDADQARDVGANGQETEAPATETEQRDDRGVDPIKAAVLGAIADRALPNLAGKDRLPEADVERVGMLPRLQDAVGLPDELGLGVAGDLAKAAVDVADDALGVGERHDRVVVEPLAQPGEQHGLVGVEGAVQQHRVGVGHGVGSDYETRRRHGLNP